MKPTPTWQLFAGLAIGLAIGLAWKPYNMQIARIGEADVIVKTWRITGESWIGQPFNPASGWQRIHATVVPKSEDTSAWVPPEVRAEERTAVADAWTTPEANAWTLPKPRISADELLPQTCHTDTQPIEPQQKPPGPSSIMLDL